MTVHRTLAEHDKLLEKEHVTMAAPRTKTRESQTAMFGEPPDTAQDELIFKRPTGFGRVNIVFRVPAAVDIEVIEEVREVFHDIVHQLERLDARIRNESLTITNESVAITPEAAAALDGGNGSVSAGVEN